MNGQLKWSVLAAGIIALVTPSLLSNFHRSAADAQAVSVSPSVGPQGPTGSTGAAGPSLIGSPVSRSLSFATAYQATTSAKPAIVTINLTSTANFSLAGGTTNSATVVIGSTNAVASGTGTIICAYTNSSTGTIALGLNQNTSQASTCTVALPVGWYFATLQTAGTVTITSAFDSSLG